MEAPDCFQLCFLSSLTGCRSLYYSDVNLFHSQRISDSCLDSVGLCTSFDSLLVLIVASHSTNLEDPNFVLARTLEVPRNNLHIVCWPLEFAFDFFADCKL